MHLQSKRRRIRARGVGYIAEYLVVLACFALAAAAGLMYVAGPMLMVRFRADQRALGSPIP